MPERPNVVVCLTDQLRPFEIGCYGGPVSTPNIDGLADRGARFELACSNCPVCTAARSVLLTGQYARTCAGTLGNAAEPVQERDRMRDPTLAEVFGSAGYRTGLIGKWHIYPRPEMLGFDTCYYPFYSHRYTGQTYYRNDRLEELVPGFGADAEIRELRGWLGERKDDPFFLFYNISQPHMPVWDQPERFRDLYSPDEVDLRPNVWLDGALPYKEHWFRIYLYDYLYYRDHLPYTERMPEGFDLRHLTALYYGMIAWADYQLGELMRALEESGLSEDTIVVFTSDHGDFLGSHHMFNKDSPLEEPLRIPLIVHWPGGLKPRTSKKQVASLVDVMPTVLSLAGLGTPSTVQGTDLSPVLDGSSETVGENVAFVEAVNHQGVAIRTGTHMYGTRNRKDQDPEVMFYDLTHDPFEMNNLAGSGEQRDLEAELRERTERWDREVPWHPLPG